MGAGVLRFLPTLTYILSLVGDWVKSLTCVTDWPLTTEARATRPAVAVERCILSVRRLGRFDDGRRCPRFSGICGEGPVVYRASIYVPQKLCPSSGSISRW